MNSSALILSKFTLCWVQILNFFRLSLTASLLIALLTGCSVQHQLLNRAGDLLSAETVSIDDDLEFELHNRMMDNPLRKK